VAIRDLIHVGELTANKRCLIMLILFHGVDIYSNDEMQLFGLFVMSLLNAVWCYILL